MDMKLNPAVIRQAREERAWSQEHLAGATGLALRTIQRIEASGSASYESANAIAAVLAVPVSALRAEGASAAASRSAFTRHHLFTGLGCVLATLVVTPPNWHVQLPTAAVLWLCC